jgi:hypothetical protein
MIDAKTYSIIILVLLLIILSVAFGTIPFFRPKLKSINDTLPTLVLLIIVMVVFSIIMILIVSLVKPDTFFTSKSYGSIQVPTIQNVQPVPPLQQSVGSTKPPLPGIIPPGPVFDQTKSQIPNFGSSTFFTSYYQFNPRDRTLKKLDIDKITDGTPIIDYYHKNDESIFVLLDGTIVSILGENIDKIKSTPPIQKIRVSGNQYVGFSNGKLYVSSDLKNWKEYPFSPMNVIDFDVPVSQNDIIYIRTQKENILWDTKNNKVISSESPDPKRFGSNLNSYVKYLQDGIIHVRGNEQQQYNGYIIGDVDNNDRLYIFPVKINDQYTIKDIFTADNNVILKIDSFVKPSDTINVSNDMITK